MIPFGTYPTPLEHAPRLAEALGLPELLIKRDDLIGLGGGGNKVRKLQYTCAEAVAAGATTLVTTGAPQSNHARLTAAAAARLGMDAVLVLHGRPPNDARGNVLLDHLLDANVVWADDTYREVEVQVRRIRERGGVPHVIPFGGSSPASIAGYADCADELLDQVPNLGLVVVGLGSGGTMAGLVSRLGPERVLGVDTGAVPDARATVAALLGGTVDPAALRIDDKQKGAGYGELTPGAKRAIRLAARTEGLLLDPTYTGRALAGLVPAATGDTVFLHTGGLPGLFGHSSVSELA